MSKKQEKIQTEAVLPDLSIQTLELVDPTVNPVLVREIKQCEGVIVSEKRNALQARPYVGPCPDINEEAGEPILIQGNVPETDLATLLKRVGIVNPKALVNASVPAFEPDTLDDEEFEENSVDEWNAVMNNTAFAVDEETGLNAYEVELKKRGQSVEDFNKFTQMANDPSFKQLLDLPAEKRQELLQGLQSILQTANDPTQQPKDPSGSSTE